MSRAKRKTSAAIGVPDLSVGDYVLCGSSTASLPGDWFLGKILWSDRDSVLLERSTMNGKTYPQLLSMESVRAAGPISDLVKIQERFRQEVRELAQAVRDAASELGRRRNEMWRRVEELAANGLQIIPDAKPKQEDPVAGLEIGLLGTAGVLAEFASGIRDMRERGVINEADDDQWLDAMLDKAERAIGACE